MTPERWKQIERLYHAALERDGNQRAAYLQQACAGDGELRREVESLLKRDGAGGLLERPVAQEAAKMIGKDESQPLTGKRLGPYEVLSKIGAGGMGDVYRAVDTKLRRDVAIKVLPNAFVYDPDRLSRFRREAQLLASLNHPNIAAIYRFDESDGVHYLVMEFVEGETLADRLLRDGAVPVDESLEIAKQICEGLEHAHEKSIIHRDLKPANIKLTVEGKVKVLDFGLAKAFELDSADAMPDSQAPTLPPGASPTIPGAILGTAHICRPSRLAARRWTSARTFSRLAACSTNFSPVSRHSREKALPTFWVRWYTKNPTGRCCPPKRRKRFGICCVAACRKTPPSAPAMRARFVFKLKKPAPLPRPLHLPS